MSTVAKVEALLINNKLQSLAWFLVQKAHYSNMKLSEEEKKISPDGKLALIWPGEDLLPLKRKSQTGRQKNKKKAATFDFDYVPHEFNR